MALTTGGTTYVTSTDLVANYPTASLALANRVDVVASGGPNSIKTSGYTITLADILGGNKFLYNSASPGTFTLPTSGLVDGMTVNVAQIGAAALTVSGGTIVGTTATTAQYQGLSFVYVASGATWYSVAPSVAAPGLTLVGSTTVSAAATVNMDNVFSATYDNYRVLMSLTASADNATYVRFRVSATDSIVNYAWQRTSVEGATFAGSRTSGDTKGYVADMRASQKNTLSLDIFDPSIATTTTLSSINNDPQGGASLKIFNVFHTVSTAYSGLTVFASTGTITGTIKIYGYKNS